MSRKTTAEPNDAKARASRIAAEIAELEAEIERVYERAAPLKGVHPLSPASAGHGSYNPSLLIAKHGLLARANAAHERIAHLKRERAAASLAAADDADRLARLKQEEADAFAAYEAAIATTRTAKERSLAAHYARKRAEEAVESLRREVEAQERAAARAAADRAENERILAGYADRVPA